MKNKDELKRLRSELYRLFLEGERVQGRNSQLEDCRRAELLALTGNFPQAFDTIKRIKSSGTRRKWLERITSAFRRSLELPHEVARIKSNDELDLLLEFDYIEAARMWVALKLKNHWACHLKIYEKTTLPIDVGAARKDVKKQSNDVHGWLAIAKATGRSEDLAEADRAIAQFEKNAKEQGRGPELVIILAERYTIDNSVKHLERATVLAKDLSDGDYFQTESLAKAWETLVKVNDCPETRSELRQAKTRLRRLAKQWEREYTERDASLEYGKDLDLENPLCLLILAEQTEDSQYLRRALKLLRDYDGIGRTTLFLKTFDVMDQWQGKNVLPRHILSEELRPPSIPDITRNSRVKKRR